MLSLDDIMRGNASKKKGPLPRFVSQLTFQAFLWIKYL